MCSFEYETVCDTNVAESQVEDEIAVCKTEQIENCDDEGQNCLFVPQQLCTVEKIDSTKVND